VHLCHWIISLPRPITDPASQYFPKERDDGHIDVSSLMFSRGTMDHSHLLQWWPACLQRMRKWRCAQSVHLSRIHGPCLEGRDDGDAHSRSAQGSLRTGIRPSNFGVLCDTSGFVANPTPPQRSPHVRQMDSSTPHSVGSEPLKRSPAHERCSTRLLPRRCKLRRDVAVLLVFAAHLRFGRRRIAMEILTLTGLSLRLTSSCMGCMLLSY
jgi:hypothetical protein